MNPMKKFLKSIVFLTLIILILSIAKQNNIFRVGDLIQANLYQGLRTVKVTEEKSKINDKNVSIDIKMPEIHYNNRDVERYINTYIRRNINNFINHQRQTSDISNKKNKSQISINYHVVFQNTDIINIVIYKSISEDKSSTILEKESYIFDLKTGQRIYIDNFLKDNEDYNVVIEKYINEYIDKNNLKADRNKIKIDKYTNYSIVDEGLNIYFNPYKQDKENISYEFKIPYSIFKNKIKIIESNNIVANIDAQTITKNNKYINSIINIPIIITSNKEIEKLINGKITTDIMEFYNNSLQEALDYSKGSLGNQEKFVANADFEVEKNSDNMLSIKVEYYKYSGGAHGYYEDVSYNIDMKTGMNLELQQLFKVDSDYKGIIDKEIRRQIEDISKKNPEYNGIYEFSGIKDNQKFYIQDDNAVIYFDLYEIAPYPAGIPEFKINIKAINHILKEEYIEIFR